MALDTNAVDLNQVADIFDQATHCAEQAGYFRGRAATERDTSYKARLEADAAKYQQIIDGWRDLLLIVTRQSHHYEERTDTDA